MSCFTWSQALNGQVIGFFAMVSEVVDVLLWQGINVYPMLEYLALNSSCGNVFHTKDGALQQLFGGPPPTH